jgi:cystathionine beta-synthase
MLDVHILDAIGNTPLVRLNFPSKGKLFAKLEYLNPGGSVKDRSAKYMIEQAEKKGILKPGGTLIDASSGNQGIATAMIGAAKGYRVIIAVSEKVSSEKLNTIKAYGAEVVICPSTDFVDDPRGYHSVACRLTQEIPNSFMPNQYFNTDNAAGHYYSLGPEIWKQTDGNITHFFAGAGTGGTISGAGKYLKEQNPRVKVIAIDSINSFRATQGNPKPYKIEGIGVDFVSPVLDYSVIDAFYEVSDDDTFAMLKKLAHQHGLLVGPSSGAIACAVEEYATELQEGDIAVMICGDSGRAYLSKNLY